MPDRRTHELFCQLLLGKKYIQVHRLMDMPSLWMGRKHRQLFHDFFGACLASALTRDPKAFLAAQLHIMLDQKRINPNLVKLAYKLCKPRET